MRTVADAYKFYIQYIDDKLVKYTSRYEEIGVEKTYLFDTIMSFEDHYTNAGINVDDLVYGNRGKFNIRLIKGYKFEAKLENLLQGYIVAYMNLLRSEKVCIDSISQYSVLKVPFNFYKYAYVELNTEFSKAILLGADMDFGAGVGRIYIKEKVRNFLNEQCTKAINWGESNKVKAQLLADGKTLYNETTNPDGVKWHVKHTEDFSYWWWWECNLPHIPTARFYKFIPTSFMNGVARQYDTVKETFNTVEKIVNSIALGNIDKLHRLRALDYSYVLRYRTNSNS
jgi:hypothetical protein